MSLKLIEATFKEQEEALATAQRCHSQITRLVKEYAQDQRLQQYTEQATAQPMGQSKRPKQNTTPSPEDNSDEDLIQGLQAYERRRAQSQHSTSIQEPQAQPTPHPQMVHHNAMQDQPHYAAGGQQQPAAAQGLAAAPALPVAGLRAFHLCPAKHRDGSGRCLLLQPYPRTAQTHCRCGHGQTEGRGVLVEFWLAGVQHFCVTTVPSAAPYQSTAQQMGAPAHYTKYIASRLELTTAHSTAKRCAMQAANFEVIVGRNYNWRLHSEATLQALAQLTWEEIVLAHSAAQ